MQQRENFYTKSKRCFSKPEFINPHLFCSICLDVFEEPNRLLCGHTFCYICIQNCVKSCRKQICPECKGDFSRRKLQKDLLASKMVDELQVKCIHSGCQFQGKHSVLKKHQRSCDYREKKDLKNIETDDVVVVIAQEQQVIEVNKNQYELEIPKINSISLMEFQALQEDSSVL